MMSAKFMKTKKITLSMLTVAIICSQLMGCSAVSKNELETMTNNNEHVELEVSEPTATTEVEESLPADTATDSTTEATATETTTTDNATSVETETSESTTTESTEIRAIEDITGNLTEAEIEAYRNPEQDPNQEMEVIIGGSDEEMSKGAHEALRAAGLE